MLLTAGNASALALGAGSSSRVLGETGGAPRHGNPWGARSGPCRSPHSRQLRTWAPAERKVGEVGRAAPWAGEGPRSRVHPGQRRRSGSGEGPRPWLHCSGAVPVPRPAQDPLYDVPDAGGGQAGGPRAPGRAVSLRERLLLTRPVWLQLRANAAAALHVLRTEPPGVSLARPDPRDWPWAAGRARGWTRACHPVPSQTFLVRKSNTRQCQALCVRLPQASGPSFVSSHYIQESPGGERAWPGGKGLEAIRSGPREIPPRTTSLPISQASPWRDLSSSSRTWSSSSAPIATPGEPAHRRLLSAGHPAPPPSLQLLSALNLQGSLTPNFLALSLASGTSFSSSFSSPEPSARQPPIRS